MKPVATLVLDNLTIEKYLDGELDPPEFFLSLKLQNHVIVDLDAEDLKYMLAWTQNFPSPKVGESRQWETIHHTIKATYLDNPNSVYWLLNLESDGERVDIDGKTFVAMQELLGNSVSRGIVSAEERRKLGLCLKCGTDGEWIRAALICRSCKGLICGC
jgi:hypothetical protein